jgi:hypothetical protein
MESMKMGRVIQFGGAGEDRKQLIRGIILAIHELMRQNEVSFLTRDIAAFISLSLFDISATVDKSVEAWEKRGYWLKADRFRMEWSWTHKYANIIGEATLGSNWSTIATAVAVIAEKLNKYELPKRHRIDRPWDGAAILLEQKLNSVRSESSTGSKNLTS